MTKGASASQTGLAGAEAPEPQSRLGPSDGIPCAGVYLKRPLAIEAWQFNNDASSYDLLHWINELQYRAGRKFAKWVNDRLHIPTLEGTMTASPGDYIIRGVQGEIYPCKREIFEQSYDRIGTAPPLGDAK